MRVIVIVSAVIFFFSCSEKQQKIEDRQSVDTLNTKKEIADNQKGIEPLVEDCFVNKELVVLLNNSAFSYNLHKGQPMGYEYELLSLFCKHNGLKLHVKVVKDAAHILDSLAAGYGHLAAANITINTERKKYNHFTLPFFKTKQVLVQRLPSNWRKMRLDDIRRQMIQDPLELDEKSVTVKQGSVFYGHLNSFAFENGLKVEVKEADRVLTTEDLIGLVDDGEIEYTVADQNTAQFYHAFYQDLDFNTAISFNQNVAWAVNKSQDKLLKKINAWIKINRGGLAFNSLEKRYFDVSRSYRRVIKEEWEERNKGQISDFDDLIKKQAVKDGIDWLLLTSLVFQESRFDPKVRSWVGARGLTQVMPATGKELGVSNPAQLYIPEVSIRVGSLYLKQLVSYWQPIVKDSVEANYFALASYNTGKGHVLDARRIAAYLGLDQNKWFGNVDKALLLKSNPEYFNLPIVKYGYCIGKEPVQYVKNIKMYYERFDQYIREKGML